VFLLPFNNILLILCIQGPGFPKNGFPLAQTVPPAPKFNPLDSKPEIRAVLSWHADDSGTMRPYVGIPASPSPPPRPSGPQPPTASLSLAHLLRNDSPSPSVEVTLRPVSPEVQADELEYLDMPNSGEDLEMPLASPIIPAVDPPADPVPAVTLVSLLIFLFYFIFIFCI
jgi:hypothetical protein